MRVELICVLRERKESKVTQFLAWTNRKRNCHKLGLKDDESPAWVAQLPRVLSRRTKVEISISCQGTCRNHQRVHERVEQKSMSLSMSLSVKK